MSEQNQTEKKRYYEPAPQDIDVANFRKVIESRRSVRKFTDKPIPSEILDECLDLALLAPNSSNLQPWTFYVVQNPTKKKQLVKACLGQLAAKTASEKLRILSRAAFLAYLSILLPSSLNSYILTISFMASLKNASSSLKDPCRIISLTFLARKSSTLVLNITSDIYLSHFLNSTTIIEIILNKILGSEA